MEEELRKLRAYIVQLEEWLHSEGGWIDAMERYCGKHGIDRDSLHRVHRKDVLAAAEKTDGSAVILEGGTIAFPDESHAS